MLKKTPQHREKLPRRMIFFAAETPEIQQSEVISAKELQNQETDVLSTQDLVQETNRVINQYQQQLKELPPAFAPKLRQEIVSYFGASSGRFDKNAVSGLNAQEYQNYRGSMIGKVQALMTEYAPTQEEIKAKKDKEKSAEVAKQSAESIQPFNFENPLNDPGDVEDPAQLSGKLEEYQKQNASLRQEGAKIMQQTAAFQKSFA